MPPKAKEPKKKKPKYNNTAPAAPITTAAPTAAPVAVATAPAASSAKIDVKDVAGKREYDARAKQYLEGLAEYSLARDVALANQEINRKELNKIIQLVTKAQNYFIGLRNMQNLDEVQMQPLRQEFATHIYGLLNKALEIVDEVSNQVEEYSQEQPGISEPNPRELLVDCAKTTSQIFDSYPQNIATTYFNFYILPLLAAQIPNFHEKLPYLLKAEQVARELRDFLKSNQAEEERESFYINLFYILKNTAHAYLAMEDFPNAHKYLQKIVDLKATHLQPKEEQDHLAALIEYAEFKPAPRPQPAVGVASAAEPAAPAPFEFRDPADGESKGGGMPGGVNKAASVAKQISSKDVVSQHLDMLKSSLDSFFADTSKPTELKDKMEKLLAKIQKDIEMFASMNKSNPSALNQYYIAHANITLGKIIARANEMRIDIPETALKPETYINVGIGLAKKIRGIEIMCDGWVTLCTRAYNQGKKDEARIYLNNAWGLGLDINKLYPTMTEYFKNILKLPPENENKDKADANASAAAGAVASNGAAVAGAPQDDKAKDGKGKKAEMQAAVADAPPAQNNPPAAVPARTLKPRASLDKNAAAINRLLGFGSCSLSPADSWAAFSGAGEQAETWAERLSSDIEGRVGRGT